MTRAQYEKELEKLEREADKRGCCVVPSRPLREPSARKPRTAKHEPRTTKRRMH